MWSGSYINKATGLHLNIFMNNVNESIPTLIN